MGAFLSFLGGQKQQDYASEQLVPFLLGVASSSTTPAADAVAALEAVAQAAEQRTSSSSSNKELREAAAEATAPLLDHPKRTVRAAAAGARNAWLALL